MQGSARRTRARHAPRPRRATGRWLPAGPAPHLELLLLGALDQVGAHLLQVLHLLRNRSGRRERGSTECSASAAAANGRRRRPRRCAACMHAGPPPPAGLGGGQGDADAVHGRALALVARPLAALLLGEGTHALRGQRHAGEALGWPEEWRGERGRQRWLLGAPRRKARRRSLLHSLFPVVWRLHMQGRLCCGGWTKEGKKWNVSPQGGGNLHGALLWRLPLDITIWGSPGRTWRRPARSRDRCAAAAAQAPPMMGWRRGERRRVGRSRRRWRGSLPAHSTFRPGALHTTAISSAVQCDGWRRQRGQEQAQCAAAAAGRRRRAPTPPTAIRGTGSSHVGNGDLQWNRGATGVNKNAKT